MSQTKAQLLDNIKDNVQLDARNSLRFADTDSSHYVAFKAPATVSSNVTWTLPAADGSANYVLATDGSGTLSWIADPAGQWVTSSSDIYFTGGNVGIGDSSPSNPLSVTGASAFNGDLTLTGASYNVVWDKSDNALEFADNAKATFGASADLQLYHDGSNSRVRESGTGNLRLEGTAVELWNDGSKVCNTFANGLQVNGISSSGGIDIAGDNLKLRLGASQDLQIFHNGTDNWIEGHNGNVGIAVNSGLEVAAKFIPNGACELYYDNAKEFRTVANGIELTSDTSANGTTQTIYLSPTSITDQSRSCSIAAENTDGNNNNALIFKTSAAATPAERLKITSDGRLRIPDNGKFVAGSGDDFQIFHDGNNNKIKTSNGSISLETATESMLDAHENGGIWLYYDNSKKFETTSTGVSVPIATSGHGPSITTTGDVYPQVTLGANRSSENNSLGYTVARWNGTDVAAIDFVAGPDTTNKDDGKIGFNTRISGGSMQRRMTIDSEGSVGINWASNIASDNWGSDTRFLSIYGTRYGCITVAGDNGTDAKYTIGAGDGNFYMCYDETNSAHRLTINEQGRVSVPGIVGVAGSSLSTVYVEASGNLCTTTSIRAAKLNITAISDLSWLYNLNPVTFNWRKKTYDGVTGLGGVQNGKEVWGSEEDGTGTQYGLIAEEVEAVKKDFCSYKKDESNNDVLSGVHYDRLVSPLIKAVQDQKKEIDALKTKVAALESA